MSLFIRFAGRDAEYRGLFLHAGSQTDLGIVARRRRIGLSISNHHPAYLIRMERIQFYPTVFRITTFYPFDHTIGL